MRRETDEGKMDPMSEGGARKHGTLGMTTLPGADLVDGSVESMSRLRSGGNKGDEEGEKAPASRLQVKNASANRAHAHNKMVEAAERRKLLKETLASQNSDDAALALKAKLMQQKAMGQRLSTFPAPATLPEGVTLRDDPMTKTKAFLTKMPKLV